MVDIFEEVEEQLRSDRYRSLVFGVLPYVAAALLLALLVALGIWGWNSHKSSQDARASESYSAALDHAAAGDFGRAYAEFGQIAKSGPKGYASLALMQQAAIRLKDNKTDEAVALFDKAAAMAPTPLIGDAARMEAILVLMDTDKETEVEGRATMLMNGKGPYAMRAREALALSKLAHGKTAAAKADLAVIIQNKTLDVPPDTLKIAQLANAMIEDGTAAQLPELIKAARAVPPASPQASGQTSAPPSTPSQAEAAQ